MSDSFVIVGGGLAAANATETLRTEGFDGRIHLIGSEAHPPYERPPLSKGYLLGADERDSAFVHPTSWYEENGVDAELGTEAVELQLGDQRVALGDGRMIHYDRLLLATGARPRRLDVPGSGADGVHYLRTIEDSERLRAELTPGGRQVVVIGSGWIGLEVTAAARTYNNDVTVVARGSIPLQGALGDELGAVFQRLHEEHGVVFQMQSAPVSFTETDGRVTGVVTDAGTIPADVVVIGAGALPNTALAEAAGLDLDNGILVDAAMRTSVPEVYAAGDVANAFHPLIGRHLRSEHWANAIDGGKAAGRSMLGQDAPFDKVPYFYTDQYDLGMEYAGFGVLTPGADVVYRGDRDAREFIAFWLADGKVVAGMNVNVWDVNETIQALVRSRSSADASALADESVDLSSLVE